jgi:hypothetical protein
LGAFKMIVEAIVSSSETMHLSCVKISTIYKKDQNQVSLVPRDLGVLSGAFKMITEPMVRLA